MNSAQLDARAVVNAGTEVDIAADATMYATAQPAPDFGAFVPGPRCMVGPMQHGLLNGLTFAVKDLIDIKGWVTGAGNPDWALSQAPALTHATVVQQLLEEGASVCGKTITDELAFSLEGENWHYGTPLNPRCPDSLPGGSSSGSAVAVAAGLADFALGTDTGGSVRVPAAFCGLFGMRPSHGRVSLTGVLPFAPDYDTVGWFARSAALLEQVGRVLLDLLDMLEMVDGADKVAGKVVDTLGRVPPRLYLAADVFELAEPKLAAHLLGCASRLNLVRTVNLFNGRHQDWAQCYQVLQGAQIRHALGAQLAQRQVRFGPAIADRFASVEAITEVQIRHETMQRLAFCASLEQLLQPGVVLVLPSTPATALKKTASNDERAAFYGAALAINALAGHAGLPQLTIPAGLLDGKPASLSFIAAHGSDSLLLRHAQQWALDIA